MKKRVLYHIRSLASGGAEKQLIYTAIAAEQSGYDVKILITHPVIHYENMLRNHKIDIIVACKTSLKYRSVKRALALSRLIKSYEPDIVHSFMGKENLWGMFVSELYGVPVRIASIRNTDDTSFEFIGFYNHWADKIICNTKLAARTACDKYRVPAGKLEVVYNTVDWECSRAAKPINGMRAALGFPENARLGVMVARFCWQKNHLGLVKALKILDDKGMLENTCFIFVGHPGKGDVAALVRSEIENCHLSDKVFMLGFREDIPEILKTSDFAILPSYYEGFPNALLEAMAAGIPVIASPVGGIPELVDNGTDGLLSDSPSPESLSEALGKYLGMDEIEKDAICRNAERKAKQFSGEYVLRRILEFYEGKL